MKGASAFALVYMFVNVRLIEYALFCAAGFTFGAVIGGYTIVYGASGVLRSLFVLETFAYYSVILIMLNDFRIKKMRSVIAIIIFTLIYSAAAALAIKYHFTIL